MDFLLLHGAWHGAWCWERVARRLHAAGHRTLVPCLPGVGERAAELSPDVDLSRHALTVARLAAGHRGAPLVAVAHSYAGAVLLAAGERCGGALAGRIFLDAVLIEDGETVMDLVPPETARRRIAEAEAAGGLAMAPPPAEAFGLTDPPDLAHVAARLTPHPLATYLEPARLTTPPGAGPPSLYVRCVRPPYEPISRSAERARRYSWPVQELPAGHDCMVSAAQATAEVLIAGAMDLTSVG